MESLIQLLRSGPLSTKIATMCLLGNLAENSLEDTMIILNSHVVLKLILEFTQSNDCLIKREAFYVFVHILLNLRQHHCIEQARELAAMDCDKTGKNLLQICVIFFKYKSVQNNIHKVVIELLSCLFGIDRNFCTQFDELGGLDAMLDI